MKFARKMCLKILLKVSKNQGFTISLEDAFFEKPQGGRSNWPPPPSCFRVNKKINTEVFVHETILIFVNICNVIKSPTRSSIAHERTNKTERPPDKPLIGTHFQVWRWRFLEEWFTVTANRFKANKFYHLYHQCKQQKNH